MNNTILDNLQCFFEWLEDIFKDNGGTVVNPEPTEDPISCVIAPELAPVRVGESLVVTNLGTQVFDTTSQPVPSQNVFVLAWIVNGVRSVLKPTALNSGDTVQVVVGAVNSLGEITECLSETITVSPALPVGIRCTQAPVINPVREGFPLTIASTGVLTYNSNNQPVPESEKFITAWLVNGTRQITTPVDFTENDTIQVIYAATDFRGVLHECVSDPITVGPPVVVLTGIECQTPPVLDDFLQGETPNVSSLPQFIDLSDNSIVPASEVSICAWLVNNQRQTSTPSNLLAGDIVVAIGCTAEPDGMIVECLSNEVTVGSIAIEEYGIVCVNNATLDPIFENGVPVISDLGDYNYVNNAQPVPNSEVFVLAWIVNGVRQTSLPAVLNVGDTLQAVMGINDLDGTVGECISNIQTVQQAQSSSITLVTPPQFDAVLRETINDNYTAGTYTPADTAESVSWTVNGVAEPSTYIMKQGDVIVGTVDAVNSPDTYPTQTVTDTVPLVTMAQQEAQILSALYATPDAAFEGYDAADTFDTTITVTNPNDLRSAVETWRANPDDMLHVMLDWNGPVSMSNPSLRGPVAGILTADTSTLSGYIRPTGGVKISPAAGATPAFDQPISVFGIPRIHFDNIGFAAQANGGNGDNIGNVTFTSSSTFPMRPLIAITNSEFGLVNWKPTEPETEYVKGIRLNVGAETMHLENNLFNGVRDSVQGKVLFLRVINNRFKRFVSDLITQFGFDTNYAGRRVYALIEGNVVSDAVDNPLFIGLHTDFYQTGTSADRHLGNSAVVRYNVYHSGTTVSDSASQFVYMDDHLTAENYAVVRDNISAPSGLNNAVMFDPSGFGNFYIKDNLFMRSGPNRTDGFDVYPRVLISNIANSDLGSCGGRLEVERNYLTLIAGDETLLTSSTDNFYHDPRPNVVSGSGTSETDHVRSDDVFSGPFLRDSNDILEYTIPNENLEALVAARLALAAFYEPINGWNGDNGAGPDDPATWPV